jgi:hypothetical protein
MKTNLMNRKKLVALDYDDSPCLLQRPEQQLLLRVESFWDCHRVKMGGVLTVCVVVLVPPSV